MAKRDEAFELFSQGKVLAGPEVEALGLKVDTAKKYYRLWKGLQQEPEATLEPEVEPEPEVVVEVPVPSEVPVRLIPDGAMFEHKGQLYSKRMIHRTGRVIADGMFKTRYPSIYKRTGRAAWLDLDTVVKPK